MQMLSLTAAVLALASAFFLYGINYETRQLEARVNAQERVAEQARSDIAILKAERAQLVDERIGHALPPFCVWLRFCPQRLLSSASAPGPAPASTRNPPAMVRFFMKLIICI